MQQILQWIFKASDHERARESDNCTTNKKKGTRQKAKSKDIALYKHSRTHQRPKRHKNFIKPILYLCRKDVAKACFCSTINLRRPANFHTNQHWIHSPLKMKKEDIIARGLGISTNKAESAAAAHGGNKVLPITDNAALSSSNTTTNNEQCEKKDKPKGENRTKTMSRMKELIRWAAAAKSEKGGKFISRKVLQFRNRGALKALPADRDDELNLESPKISFRWEVESCSSTTSSAISMASSSRNIDRTINMISLTSTPTHDKDLSFKRKGNWITTDSDFVVLEL